MGVSERRLQYAFAEVFGIGPNEFMRNRAVQAARRELAAPEDPNLRVAEVAAAHGFHHAGRFAAYYRSIYGESPAETLREAATGSI